MGTAQKTKGPKISFKSFFNRISRGTIQQILANLKSSDNGAEVEELIRQIEKFLDKKAPKLPQRSFVEKPRPLLGCRKVSKKFMQDFTKMAFQAGLPERSQIIESEMIAKDIIFKEEVYPRDYKSDEINNRIGELAASKDQNFKPIIIDTRKILINGYCRWKALIRKNNNDSNFKIKVLIIDGGGDDEQLKHWAVVYNSKTENELSKKDKTTYARSVFGKISKKKLAEDLGVNSETIRRWTKPNAEAKFKEYIKDLKDLHSQNLSPAEIGKRLGKSRSTIERHIKMYIINPQVKKTIPPWVYKTSYWKTNLDPNNKYFGKAAQQYMKNLFYYHTEPNDLVVDFFAGSATTYRVCKDMGLRCKLYDIAPVGGTGYICNKWDIADGVPPELKNEKIDMVFLDPPYWRQAYGMYSNDPADLGNMELEEYNAVMYNFFNALKQIDVKKLSIMINPTQYDKKTKKFLFADHILLFHEMLFDAFEIIDRFHLRATTGSASFVALMRDNKKCVNGTRDFIVYKKIK